MREYGAQKPTGVVPAEQFVDMQLFLVSRTAICGAAGGRTQGHPTITPDHVPGPSYRRRVARGRVRG